MSESYTARNFRYQTLSAPTYTALYSFLAPEPDSQFLRSQYHSFHRFLSALTTVSRQSRAKYLAAAVYRVESDLHFLELLRVAGAFGFQHPSLAR